MLFKNVSLLQALIFFLSLGSIVADKKTWANESQCHYETWTWNTIQKRSVKKQKISKLRSDLTVEERGVTDGCSVCIEDQIEILIPRLPPFLMCKRYSEKVREALMMAQKSGFPIKSLVGYRVGKSKGPVNDLGERTQFSNHSYGTALDVNSEQNGLYDFCIKFQSGANSDCKLIRGGAYIPTANGAITKSSTIYRNMLAQGFKWGGEINGKQKDFMHFSLDGM